MGGRWLHRGEIWTDWCGGFHAGMMWLIAGRTGDSWWRRTSEHYSGLLEHRQHDRNVHELKHLVLHECTGSPTDPEAWTGRNLLERPMIHGHSLQLADIDGDGNLDIFAAEMAKWQEQKTEPDHPDATAWILYDDGQGHFRTSIFSKGIDFHEARGADLDGDGDLDILDKPYNWKAPRVDVWINEGR
jgi:FG-GAP-like repeat